MSFKVSIQGPDGKVTFQASAPVSETRNASYDPYNIIHLPTSINAYRSTSSRKLSIQGKLVSRNANEGGANAKYLNLVRGWLLPDFGGTGATPPIVFLSAYENDNITNLPCIIISYTWNFPDDVDYINSVPAMPVIGMLNIELEEIYSPEQVTAGVWKIKQTASGSFANDPSPGDSLKPSIGGALKGGLALGGLGSGVLGDFRNKIMSAGSLLGSVSTLGAIGGALAGKALLGNNAGAALGRVIGGNLGGIVQSSPILRDIKTTAGVLNNNVFVNGISAANVAAQTNTDVEAFRQQRLIAQRDSFQRDQNPTPPNVTDLT